MHNPAVLHWLQTEFAQLEKLCSVCTGAFILGMAGLLQGHTATTYYQHYAEWRITFPHIALNTTQRFVDNGKVITSAGVSAGIDMSLEVVRQCLQNLLPDADVKTAQLLEYHFVK